MEIPFYDNEPSSSEEENIQLLTTADSNVEFDSLDKDRLSSWTVDDTIYEDNDPPDSSISVRKKIRANLNISGEDEKLYGYIKRPKISPDNENRLQAVTLHTNEIKNPYLNNISDYQNIAKPNSVYIDSNDPNIIFAAELPSANNGVVSHSRYHARDDDDDKRIQTRVILNPPFHSSVAREFLLVQGGLTQYERDHFHKPVFPPREFNLRCELAKTQSAKKDVLVHAVRSINDLSSSTDHLILIEYLEPQPPVFLNQGMGAFIVNWINPQHVGIEYAKPVEGYNRVLSQNEKMPLMGMLKKGESMLTLCTSLYNTPLFKHDIPSTDYLLTFNLENPREPSPPVSRVYSAKIRRVDNLFIAGKMEPIARVFQPYDDAYNETTTSFENYLLQQYFKKMNERLSREQIYCLFPYLKKDGQLTDFHERHKQMFTVSDHIYRSRNNLPISIPRYLTPESVCLLQSCMVSHYLLEKAGIHNIFSFSNTSGTQYLRDKENIKIIYDEVHNRCQAMREKVQGNFADSISEENCSYKLAYASYQRMESIIYREKMASEFFVERIYRTTWNLTHHYINSIIEGKDRLELTTSNYFTDDLFPDAFGEDYIFLCNKTLRNRKGTTSGKGDEENGEEGGGKSKNSNDLRQIKKPDLIKMAIKLGMSRDEAETTKRWPLVQFIARNSYNENPDLYRDQKYNQQQLNQEFMERIQCLFNEQRDKLIKTDVQPKVSSAPGIAVNFQHTDYNQLRSLDHPDDMTQSFNIGGFPGGFNSDVNKSLTGQPIGVGGNYDKSKNAYVSSRGIPLLVRHLEVRVNGKGVAEVTGHYTRHQREVGNTLEMEKRLFQKNVPLEAILRQFSRFDKKMIPVVKKKIQAASTQKSSTKRTSSKPKKSKSQSPANMINEETNPRKLTTLLSKILDTVEKKDVNKCFTKLPVPNAPWAEDYYRQIPTIIDFTILEQRIRSFGYTHTELERDIRQLYENTLTFNGAEHPLTMLAKEFVVVVKKYIEDNMDAFYRAEEQLQPPEVPVDIGPNPYENI